MAKSLKDLASLIGNAFFSATPVGQAYNATQRAVPIVQNSISQFAQNYPRASQVISKAEPAYNKMQNFVRSIPSQPFQYQANTPYRPVNSLLNLGANIALSIPNAPFQAFKSAYQFPQSQNKREAIGNAAGLVNAALAGSMPKGIGNVGNKIASQPKYLSPLQKVGSSIVSGAKTGSQFGGFGGLMTGLEQGKDLIDPGEYVRNLLGNTATGVAAGSALGGALGGVGSGIKQTKEWMQGQARTQAQSHTQKIMLAENRLKPQWARGLTQDQIEKKLYDYYKVQMNQGGFVDFGAEVGKQFKAPYKRGDITKIESALDEILGTDSYMNRGKYTERLPARKTAFSELEHYANQGDEQAKALLEQARGLEMDLINAQSAKAGNVTKGRLSDVSGLVKQGYTKDQAEFILQNRKDMMDVKSPGMDKIRANLDKYSPVGTEGTVKVYRVASKGAGLQEGKMVFDSKDAAIKFRDEFGYKRGQPEIVEMTVKKSDLLIPKDLGYKGNYGQEMVYAPNVAQPPVTNIPSTGGEIGKGGVPLNTQNQTKFVPSKTEKNLGIGKEATPIPLSQNKGLVGQPTAIQFSKSGTVPTNQAQKAKVDPFVAEMEAQVGKTPINIKPKKKIPQYAGSDGDQMASRAQIAAEGNQQGFQKIFSTFIGEREAARTRGTQVGSKIRILPEKPEEIIKAIEDPSAKVSPEVNKYIAEFRKLDDEVFAQAEKMGLDIRYLKNHVAHFWEQDPKVVEQAYTVFKKKYGLNNSRVIPTYEEGISMGLKPKYTSPSQILAESVRRLEEVRSGMKAFEQLKDQGFIVPAAVGIRQQGFAPITAPGFPRTAGRINQDLGVVGNWYAPQNIADQLNRVFAPKDYGVIGDITGKTRGVSGVLQDVGLSGGIPGTPINAFGMAQVQKETLAGRPIQAVKSFFTSISDGKTKKFFEDNAEQIIKMQERNVPVRSNFSIEGLAGTNVKDTAVSMVRNVLSREFGSAWKDVGTIWNKAVNNPTFQRFMPQLQVRLFNDIEKSALKSGKNAQQAADIAAKAVQNFYGTVGSDVVARGQGWQDPLVQNVAGTVLFAPKFRESMINFWVNNVKSLKNPLALENRANIAFIGGAIATYMAMDKINYALNGKHMSENPPGTEDKLLMPGGDGSVVGVPFLSSIATIPRALYREGNMLIRGDVAGAARDVGQSFSSMLIKPIADVLANSDYFGGQIAKDEDTAPEKMKAQAQYLIKSYLGHPYLKELLTKSYQDDPAYQRLSRAMELPLRFYSEASLQGKRYYAERDAAVKGMSAKEQSAFNAIPKYDKEDPNDPNTRILKYQVYLTYPKVFEAKQKIELEMAAKTGKAIDPLYMVDYNTAKKYMRYETLPEGSQDRKAMTKAYPELIALFDVRGKYFDENPISGLGVSKRPIASEEVQAAMDRKDWTAPGVREYLDANAQWNNKQREILGLPPLDGYGSFAKKPKKVSIKKITPKKIRISMPKASKIQTIKVPKAPSFKKSTSRKAIKITAGKPIKYTKIKGLTNSKKLV